MVNPPDPSYVSPIAKMRLQQIKLSNAKLAGGANYVSPIVKNIMGRTPGPKINVPNPASKAIVKRIS